MASGLTAGSIGPPVQSVESFNRKRSEAGPPNTMAPVRPFPSGKASSKAVAGLSYQSTRRLRPGGPGRLARRSAQMLGRDDDGSGGQSRAQTTSRVRDARHRSASEGARYPLRVRASNREGERNRASQDAAPDWCWWSRRYADADVGFLVFAAACLRASDVWAPNFLVKRSTRPSVSMIF